jgi:hypothetical protein
MLAPNTMLGRYQVIGEVGRGGMAVVYEAVHVELGKPVAVKELVLGAADANLAERFLREARTSGALSHPNVVAVFDYFEHEGLPYIAMEYVGGGSLRPLVGTLTLAQVSGVLEGVLAGLAHAERHGIVHRDLKPENLLVTDEGLVKIADFGIAKAIDRTAVGHSLTATGMTVGTPTYMAPEQARAERVGPRADLYSLGVIAYEMLTASVPFGGADTPVAAILMQHISQPVPDPLARRPDLDPELAAWTLRMLAKEPTARPAGAAQAWDELEPIVLRLLGPRWRKQATLPVPAPRPSLPPAPFETPSSPEDGQDAYDTYAPQAVPPPAAAAAPPPEPTVAAAPPPPEPVVAPEPAPAPPVAAAEPATAPVAAAEPVAAPDPSPPPATPTTRKSPLAAVLVLAAAAVLVLAVVLALTDNGPKTPAKAATGKVTPTATSTALTEAQVVKQVGDILDFSAQGRAQRVAGNFDAALTNRRETLRRVQALERRTDLLSDDLKLLETAAQKTVAAVVAYKACGGFACAPAATHASGQAKLAFTQAFNPLAQRYLHRTYGAADF